MGCDIHMRVEVFVEDAWRPANVEPYEDRNYDAFAILANVRNGSAFAGCKTGDGFVFISEPRGLPHDIARHDDPHDEDDEDDEDDDGARAGYWFGDHSHSWLTLAELEAADWQRTAVKCGVVGAKEFLAWHERGGGRPRSYCGGITGPGIRYVLNGTMLVAVKDGSADDRMYTTVEWSETYAEASGRFHSEFMPRLRALGLPPEHVRIVFGFDS